MSDPYHLRVFISSPGDVPQERGLAAEVIQNLNFDGEFKGEFTLEALRWDDPNVTLPLPANVTTQKSVDRYLIKPSECDLVIVIFWAKMGTKAHIDGEDYLSGTHYEFKDALGADVETWVYRRTANPGIDVTKPDYKKRLEQWEIVQEFFKDFNAPDGSINMSYNAYEQPDDFRKLFEEQLRTYLRYLRRHPRPAKTITPDIELEYWEGSPFPGLRAFDEEDTPIFFGRGRETDDLLQKVADQRFVAVVGASGSGKSSLVAAGLIPRLRDEGIPGSEKWAIARFTPGADPFLAVAEALIEGPLAGDPAAYVERCDQLKGSLAQAPNNLARTLGHALKDTEVLLFVDQFEELFTLTPEGQRKPFVQMLTHPADNVRVIITMRADFYHQAVPYLETPLRTGTFTLDKPDQFALLEMIERPAERAALQFDDGLPQRIVRDTGDEPGALALMAYALDELYKIAEARGDRCITSKNYGDLGGVQGAIGKRAETAFDALPGTPEDKADLLGAVFRELVSVDERGMATRRRATFNPKALDADVHAMIAAFVDARLLTASQHGNVATVEVAHEALFRKWPTLDGWIGQYKDDLYLLSQMRRAASLWQSKGRNRDFLWLGERGQEVQAMLERLGPELDAVEKAFARPEQEHLLDEIADIDTPHARRSEIGLRLHVLGDPRPGVGLRPDGLPDIVWCAVPGGTIKYRFLKPFTVHPFFIAKYLVTYSQFQAFLDADDGFENENWWRRLEEPKQPIFQQGQRYRNYPRNNVSWCHAMAFVRWLNARLQRQVFRPKNDPESSFVVGQNLEIRLPTEWEWQHAATSGKPDNEYPWGAWDDRLANTKAAGISRPTAVGMYPAGAAECGALDMTGNLWEWCLNDDQFNINNTFGHPRALKGGDYDSVYFGATTSERWARTPESFDKAYGFRVVCAPLHHHSDLQ